MSKYAIDDTSLTSVADAIREKGGTSSPLAFPQGFVDAIGNISGGGGSLTPFVLRPDAEMVQQWSYDKLIVEDEGVTLPAYSTSTKTLKSYSNFAEKPTLDTANNDYMLTYRMMASPVYSDSSTSAGKYEFFIGSWFYEIVSYNPRDITIGGISNLGATFIMQNTHQINVYCYSASEIATATGTMGTQFTLTQPAISSGKLIAREPNLIVTGHFRGLTSAWWAKMTDIRYQYICELYKAPKGSMNVDGWEHTNNALHIIDCWNNGGTLT